MLFVVKPELFDRVDSYRGPQHLKKHNFAREVDAKGRLVRSESFLGVRQVHRLPIELCFVHKNKLWARILGLDGYIQVLLNLGI